MQDDLFGLAGEKVIHNLFFALLPDAATQAAIQAEASRLRARHAPRGRWLNPWRYHMTLHYLGSFAPLPEQVATAAGRAAEAVRAPAFELVLDRAGSFQDAIGWLGCAQANPALGQLWESLRAALARARVRVEGPRNFVPHLTLLRESRDALPSQAIEPVSWPVREFVLVDSVLGQRNAYEPLGRWPLV
jgi:2'-5' RNA ligase